MDDRGEGLNIAEVLEKQAALDAQRDSKEFINIQGSVSMGDKLGVHQRIITAVLKDDDYRQLLLMAAFDNKQEALLCADAITERLRYGVDITPICDRVAAQCAVGGARVKEILTAMASYTLHTNYGGRIPDWKKKQDNKSIG